MKCHPIRRTTDMGEDYSHNRDYIGKYWNRKYIRAIQAVLNSTKGKIGKGTSFFRKAFGENIEEYHKLEKTVKVTPKKRRKMTPKS